MDYSSQLVRNWPVIQTSDGMWRSVSHKLKLAGPGFSTRERAVYFAPMVKQDAAATKTMADRYTEMGLQP